MKKKQLSSVLVKPSGPDCNLACTYCFYLEKAGLYHQQKVHRMDDETLENLIRQVMNRLDRKFLLAGKEENQH